MMICRLCDPVSCVRIEMDETFIVTCAASSLLLTILLPSMSCDSLGKSETHCVVSKFIFLAPCCET